MQAPFRGLCSNLAIFHCVLSHMLCHSELSPWRWAQFLCVSGCSSSTAAHGGGGRHSSFHHTFKPHPVSMTPIGMQLKSLYTPEGSITEVRHEHMKIYQQHTQANFRWVAAQTQCDLIHLNFCCHLKVNWRQRLKAASTEWPSLKQQRRNTPKKKKDRKPVFSERGSSRS